MVIFFKFFKKLHLISLELFKKQKPSVCIIMNHQSWFCGVMK